MRSLTICGAAICLAAMLLVAPTTATAQACGRGNVATALIHDDIVVDGDLSDWPEGLETYQISSRPEGSFRVVYSPEHDRVFIAAHVNYDHLDVGNSYSRTDAIEVYTWGGDPANDESCQPRGGGHDPIQFAYVPGDGSYVPNCGNPCWYSRGRHQDATPRGAQAAHLKTATGVYYEMAIPVFVDDEATPIDLEDGGRSIGFDVVVVDRDNGRLRWVPWGNPSTSKYSSPSHVATLILSPERAASSFSLASLGRFLGHVLLLGVVLAAAVGGGMALRGVRGPGTTERLDSLEKRLTDTQDVMLALSEKCDRLETKLNEVQPS